MRQLEFKKNQYGPIGETITLRYQRGLFLPEQGLSSFEKAARESQVEDAFLSIGKKLESRGEELSPSRTSHSYAPTVIAKQPDAKGMKKADRPATDSRRDAEARNREAEECH